MYIGFEIIVVSLKMSLRENLLVPFILKNIPVTSDSDNCKVLQLLFFSWIKINVFLSGLRCFRLKDAEESSSLSVALWFFPGELYKIRCLKWCISRTKIPLIPNFWRYIRNEFSQSMNKVVSDPNQFRMMVDMFSFRANYLELLVEIHYHFGANVFGCND